MKNENKSQIKTNFLDIIQLTNLIKNEVSETRICVCSQIKPNLLGPVDRVTVARICRDIPLSETSFSC